MTDDQRFAGQRPDVISFKTDILAEDVTVTGVVSADLLTSITTTDADFVVKLIDVFPDSLSCNDINIYEAQKSDFQKAVIRIYHDAKSASNRCCLF